MAFDFNSFSRLKTRWGGGGGGGAGGIPLHGLYGVGDVPLDRVWFLAPALNKRVCPGPVLDRIWLQDCRRVFGNPKSETFVCIHLAGDQSK